MATSCTRELLYTRAGVFPWWAASRPWHCGERAAAFQKAPSLGNADKTSAPDFALDFSCFAPKIRVIFAVATEALVSCLHRRKSSNQTSWRTLQQNLTSQCSTRSRSCTTHPSSHSHRNGTNTNQQPELTRENQEVQQDRTQLLWPGQTMG